MQQLVSPFGLLGLRRKVRDGDILYRFILVFEGDEYGTIFKEFGGAVVAELSVAGVAHLYVYA